MKKLLSFAILSLMTVTSLASCSEGPLEIELEDAVPAAYVDEEYDFEDTIIKQKGVKYTIECFYQNYLTLEEHTIPVNGFKFTPTENYDVSVVVHASKGSQKATRTTLVDVTIAGDPIDQLIASGGYSGYADPGIRKELTIDEKWLHGENSKSALEVFFSGNNQYTWGAAVLCLNNFRLLDEWTDKDFKDGILKFNVYNPTDYNFRFQLRLCDTLDKLVNIDWGHSLNIEQVAEPGKWTEILYPLRAMGVDHTYFVNEEGTRDDSLTVKVKWDGTPTEKPTPIYTWQMYIDDVDVVPHSYYPEMDTKCYSTAETADYGLENTLLDTTLTNGWGSANARYDRDFVFNANRESKSSAYLTFDGAVKKDYSLGYSFVMNLGSAYENDQIKVLPETNHGVLRADFHFNEAVDNRTIKVVSVTETFIDDHSDWLVHYSNPVVLEQSSDGWCHLEFDFAKDDAFINAGEAVRLGFSFVGVNDTNKANAVIHIDNVLYYGNEGLVRETFADGWENTNALDTGWQTCRVDRDYDTFYNKEYNSRSSTLLTFSGLSYSASDVKYSYILDTYNMCKQEGIEGGISVSHGLLTVDFLFSSNITDKTIKVIAVNDSWNASVNAAVAELTPLEDGWQRLTLDFAALSQFAKIKNCIRLGFSFPGITDANKDSAKINIDNIFFDQNGGSPEVIIEDITYGWENMSIDTGWSKSVISYDKENVCKERTDSYSSLKLTFNGITPDGNLGYMVALSPEEQGLSPLPNATKGTFEFDVKLSEDITDKSIELAFVQSSTWDMKRTTIELGTASSDGWYHVSVNLADGVPFAGITSAIRIVIGIKGVNDANKNTAVTYLDNITYTA